MTRKGSNTYLNLFNEDLGDAWLSYKGHLLEQKEHCLQTERRKMLSLSSIKEESEHRKYMQRFLKKRNNDSIDTE